MGLGTLKVSKPGAGAVGAEPEWDSSISWGGALTVDVIRGDLGLMRSSNGHHERLLGRMLGERRVRGLVTDNTALGFPAYYLLKTPLFCNVALSGAFAAGLADELPGAGGNRDADIVTDPDACP